MNTLKLLKYECRRNLLPLILFTAIASLIVCTVYATSDLFYISCTETAVSVQGRFIRINDSLTGTPTAVLAVLCVFVPVFQFSYRMKSRSADLWYSLPVRREKLTLVRTVGGLALVLVPYTVSYWLGFLILLCRENYFAMYGYPLYYLAALPLGILLFGFYAIVYTRAHTVWDGLAFMLGWTFVFVMPFNYLSGCNVYPTRVKAFDFLPFGPLIRVNALFDNMIRRIGTDSLLQLAWTLPFALLEGAGAYAGLFLTCRKEKTEDAEQLSSSLWGYRVLVPYYVFSLASSLDLHDLQIALIMAALVLVGGLIGFAAYRRSFKLRPCDVITLAASFSAGIAMAALAGYCIAPLL